MSSSTMQAQLREQLGSRHSRLLRAEGRLPASLQGGEGDHVNLSIDSREFFRLRREHVHLFDLDLPNGVESATVRELQWSSLGDELVHVEFRRVTRGVKTEVEVALDFVGMATGGVVNHLVNSIEVRCLPRDIPDSIEVEVGEMEAGHPLLAGDLKLPDGFELVSPADLQIAVVGAADSLEESDGDEEAEGESSEPAPPPAE